MSSLDTYLKHMADKNASDLYFTTGAPPSMKVEGETHPISKKRLEPGTVKAIAYEIMDERQQRDFEERLEMNLGLTVEGVGRYRVNIYRQRGEVAMVIRYIKANIPDIKTLNLPDVLGELIGEKKGLILVVGSTGSGKSTTLASMLDHRNSAKTGHILTIEDPIEYVFEHKRSILGQREVGLDTLSYENALREAMREAPDVIMIGEVRDRRTMEAAIAYADTGHLCLSTLHAVNAYQALDRIINMFPPDAKNQILMDLSLNLRGIISQRLVPGKKGLRVPAVEIMLGGGYISELIREGEIHKIKDAMTRGSKEGMQTFDQSLFELFKTNKVELNTALDFADSRSDLEWKINFGGGVGEINRSHGSDQIAAPGADFEELTINK
jgi:twitching motility protein PilU